jgi:hypothetical protein
MPDQIPQLPVPSAEDIQKFKAKVPSGGISAGGGLPIPSAEDIKKFKVPVAEKKKPMASPSVLEKPVASSVAGLRPMQSSLASKLAEPKAEIKQAAPQENVSVIGSQGKLLIPEPTKKFPAVTETVTTYKNVPVSAPSKNTKNVPLNPELMLQAIAKNEGGKLGVKTAIKGKGISNTASGTYQITEGTLENIYNKDVDLKKSYNNFQQFKREFNSNPEVERQAALSHMSDLINQFGIHALTAWYSPDHAARAAAGSTSALKEVPRRDAGNKITAGNYFKNAFSNYKNLLGMQSEQAKTARIPVKQEVIKEPAVEVPSLEKFNVLSPNWYGGPVTKETKPEPTKKFGILEDIGNVFRSSGARLASGIAGLPNFAQKAGLMMTTKMLGIDDEYNALPIQAKREIDTVMSGIAQSGGIPSGDFSREAQNYFINKSDEFLENTNKSDKYLNERFGDFFKDPSVDKAADLFLEIPKGFAGSLPYMINPMLGAVSAASEQYNKDINEADGKLGWGQLANAGVTGVSEYYIERISNGILNKSIRDAIGVPKAASTLAKGFIKSVLKDVGMEGGGEGLTQFAQSLSDDITKGREIDWVKTANEVMDAAITGAGIAAGMRTTGAGVGYLAKKVMPNSEKNKVDRNTRAIMDLNTKKGPDNSPAVNAVIDSKIKELDDDNKNIINSNIDKVKSLSDDQLTEIVNIDNGINEIYNKRDAVVADPNLNDEEKQSLLDHLKSQATTLNQEKDAIQKQTTGQIPVQPEAGARVQMAQGEPQAEPQVPAEEGQGQEVVSTKKLSRQERKRANEIVDILDKADESEQDKTLTGVKYNDIFIGDESLGDILNENKLSIDEKRTIKEIFRRNIGYFNFDKADEQNFLEDSANPEDIQDIYEALSMLPVVESSQYSNYNKQNYDNVKDEIDYIVSNPEKYTANVVSVVTKIKDKLDNPKSSSTRLYAVDVNKMLGVQPAEDKNKLSKEERDSLIKELESITKTKDENIQAKGPRAKVVAEEATVKTDQAQQGAAEQPIQASNKRGEIKSSLERLKDAGILRSAITGRKDISQGEIDSQMALTDAMANVWKETTGRDDFYENFFNDVSEGDIDAIMEKGGVLFQNLELPQRPLTRVSLGVFDLPEFKKMEGQEVSINSVKDLARTRGKQIEKELMQTVLDYDKYQDVKKISFDEFKSDVEMQVMKLEKVMSSTYADYGMGNLGSTDIYGGRQKAYTTIYNSPVDHGEYGHFGGDFRPSAISSGTITFGSDFSWNDWEVKQIPGTEQYVAIDRSMPSDVSQDQISNYIGTAGSKEAVEKWIEDRKNYGANLNVGLFGHTRGWYSGEGPYYLAELQSDYFQKNDANYLYLPEIKAQGIDPKEIAKQKYDDEYIEYEVEKIKESLNVKIEVEEKPGILDRLLKAYIYKPNGEKLTDFPIATKLTFKDTSAILYFEYGLLRNVADIIEGSMVHEDINLQPYLLKALQENFNFIEDTKRNYNRVKKEISKNRDKVTEKYELDIVRKEAEKIKNSEKGASIRKQFIASQKIHEIRLLKEAFRSAAQEGAEILRFPTPYTLAVIEGFVNKSGETGAPYEIINGDPERLRMGDTIDYGGTEMTVLDTAGDSFSAAPSSEVQYYDYYDYINSEVDYFLDETIGQLRRGGINDINNITQSDIDSFDFEDLPWQASSTQDILLAALNDSETGTISLRDVENNIESSIRDSLYDLPINDLFYGEDIYSDDNNGYYVLERRNQIEGFSQPDQYQSTSDFENFEENLTDDDHKTVVNKYKELNKVFKKMRPDAEVVTDDNGMQWIETKLTPEDANNPVIAFQEEGGNIKGAVDFSNDNKASVYMFNGADVSSLAHEMSGHLSRRFLEQLSNVDEDFASDYEKAKKWAGVKDNQWTIAAEEKWARGFERYLRDGKAPTKALKSVFDNLREWLKNIYKYIKGSSIDIELTPEITRVFDNLLGARSEDVGIKELPGYARMMGEVEGIVDKSFKRGVSYMQTMDNAIQYMSKSKVYEDATDIQREAMVREVRKMFKQKEKKAPTAQKILGQEPTKTTVVIDEAKEISKRLKALDAAEQTGKKIGYKQGLKEAEDVKKEVLDYVKSLKVNNKISGPQYKAIINAINTNLRNPAIRKRAEKRIENIINKANYADQLDRAGKLNKAIRTASKSKTLPPNISSMAKRFAQINPNTVDNIEEYIDMANIVYASVSKPIRVIAEEAMVNEYSDMKIKEALDMQKKALLDEYNYLVDAGLIEPGMSMEDIQQYILDVEGKKIEAKKDEEQKIRKRLNSLFDVLSGGANVILEDGVNPFTGEQVELTAQDRQLLKDFIAMDLNKLPIASAYRAQEALMNYIVNGKKFGMRGILARYQGAENVKVAINKGLKAGDFRWIVGGSWWGSKKWAKEVESIPGLFTWLWRGRTRGGEMMKLMGLDEFMAGAAKGKLDRIDAENEYIAKFLNKKPNGKRFNNISNTYERLVYGYLSRTVDGSPEKKQKEFERRHRIIGQIVQAMEQSRNKDLIEEGKILGKEYDKIKNAKSIDDIQGKFDKINEDAVKFISGKFDQNFDFIESVAEGIYNLVLNKDELYTPDMFRDIVEKDVNVAEAQQTVDLPFDLLNKKPAGTMMENKRIQNLPGYDIENKDASNVTKILRLDFDASAFNAYEKALVDAYTAEAVQKYSAFVNSKDFSKLFDSAQDESLFKEIVNFYINNERGKIGYKSDLKAVQNLSNRLKSLSTYRALGSATAILKQAASAAVNTTINLSNDPYALKQVGKALLFNSDIQDFINNHRGEINLRGAETTADIKSAEKLIRESKYQTVTDVLDVVDKAGRLQMKSLSAGDVPMARASWFGYYVHALKQQGKPYKNIDWQTADIDKDALAYANREISINQNASMPSTMGKAFTSKNPATRLIMAYVFPYTSFLFNAKSRLKTDITVLTSKLATAEDKQAAGRSMAATLAELPAYIVMQTTINYTLVGLANMFLGYDEDEEDEKLRLKRYTELAVTRIITDLLSPTPNVGDVATVAAFNALLEKAQADPEMTKEDEKMDVFKLFESKPESMAAAMAELLAQPISSTVRRADDIYTTFDMINGDYYVTDTGKEIEFSSEDKKMLKVAGAMQLMGSLNLLPSEAESLAKKMVKTIEKRAKE